eukprot:2236686-Pleurochrysis_carterae.AAC.3
MGGGDYVKGWVPLSARTEWLPPARKPDSTEVTPLRPTHLSFPLAFARTADVVQSQNFCEKHGSSAVCQPSTTKEAEPLLFG